VSASSALVDAARLAVELDSQAVRWQDAGRLWRAIMLSPWVEVCEALLRGEAVPLSLDPVWVRRFGLRSAA